MLAKDTNLSSATALIMDPEWVMEQKLDGHRVLMHVQEDEVHAYNRNGDRYSKGVPQEVLADILEGFRPGDIVDGELVGDEYWAFDLPFRSGTDKTHDEYVERRIHLRKSRSYDRVLPQARLAEAKARLMRRVRDEGGEGVMVKHLYSTYEPGGRSTKMLKCKYVKTIDCIVSSLERNGKNAIGLSVIRDGKLVEIGACSMNGKGSVELGDVVLIRYLYALNEEAPRLFQPTLLEVRDDKPVGECLIDQVAYTRKVVLP